MVNLRPEHLDDIILNEKTRKVLTTIIESANIRNRVLGSLLISAPPGLGKSTIAHAICNEVGANMEFSNGANASSIKNIAPFIMRLKEGDIFFIDEIHRLTKTVQEFLYTVIEDNFCILGKEQLRIDIPPFTMIGATTHIGRLTKPFRDRFKHHIVLPLYNDDELTQIAQTNINKLEIKVDNEALSFIVSISRGTPRILNKFLEWSRDYMITNKVMVLGKKHVKYAMYLIDIDENGLGRDDRRYIKYLAQNGTVGLATIAAALNLPKETIEETIEPYLLTMGYVLKTSNGRELGRAVQSLSKMQP